MMKRYLVKCYMLLWRGYFRLKSEIIKRLNNIQGEGVIYSRGKLSIKNKGTFILKGDVEINSGYRANRINGYKCSCITIDKDAKLVLGKNVGLSNSIIYCSKQIEIGDDTLIGGDCKIIDMDFHPINPLERVNKNYSNVKKKPIKIGDNVFVGMNTIVLKGSRIGDNSIISAGSIVSNDIPENEIWGIRSIDKIGKIQ